MFFWNCLGVVLCTLAVPVNRIINSVDGAHVAKVLIHDMLLNGTIGHADARVAGQFITMICEHVGGS